MEEYRLVRKIEDDQFIVHFFFECNYLMNIDIEVKDRENVPAVDLHNKSAVSQWCFGLWSVIQRSMSRVPEKTLAIRIPGTAGATDIEGGLACPNCKVPLIKKAPCCSSGKPTLRCPKCGISYRTPEPPPKEGSKGD